MELNRNQFFLLGLVCVAMGVQLRLVDTFVLNEAATQFLAERRAAAAAPAASGESSSDDAPVIVSATQTVIRPPDWSGWLLLSVGGVMVLQSLVMRRPG